MKKLLILICLFSVNQFAIADEEQRRFDGVYIGGSIGAINANSKSVEKYKDDGIATGWTNGNKPEGLKIGGILGYNFVTSKNILLGVEANYHFYGADDETYDKDEGILDIDFTTQTNFKQKAALKARLGYVFNNDKTLAFLTAGYSTGKIRTKFTDVSDAVSQSETNWHEGYLVGGGIEHFVNEKLTAKIEYNYTDFNSKKIDANIYETFYNNRIDEHAVQIGLIYHF